MTIENRDGHGPGHAPRASRVPQINNATEIAMRWRNSRTPLWDCLPPEVSPTVNHDQTAPVNAERRAIAERLSAFEDSLLNPLRPQP